MSQHPEDTATNRFRTWWAALFAAFSFALVTALIVAVAGDRLASPELLMSDVARAEARTESLVEVEAAQIAGISEAGVADDASNTVRLPVAKALPIATKKLNNKVAKSEIPVPGAAEAAPAEESSEEEGDDSEGEPTEEEKSE